MKNGQKLKLGDAHVTPRNIQEVQASKLGDAQGIPFFINKISGRLSWRYIVIASYTMCYSWSVLVFVFCFLFFCFLYYMVGSQQIFVLEQTHSVLIAKNTLVFTLIVLRLFYFSSTAFSSCFSLIFCSELVCFLW